jgi:hypothetical protein
MLRVGKDGWLVKRVRVNDGKRDKGWKWEKEGRVQSRKRR